MDVGDKWRVSEATKVGWSKSKRGMIACSRAGELLFLPFSRSHSLSRAQTRKLTLDPGCCSSSSSDGTIKLWDLSAPSLALVTLRDHTADVWAIAWAPEPLTTTGNGNVIEGLGGAAAGLGGGRMCSAGEDGRLRWWRGGG